MADSDGVVCAVKAHPSSRRSPKSVVDEWVRWAMNKRGGSDVSQEPRRQTRPSWFQLLTAGYHWVTWAFICAMVFSQFLSIVWNYTTTRTPVSYGHVPMDGPAQIVGFNDVPYDDRVVVCVKAAGTAGDYEPWQISALRAANKMTLIDSTGTSKTGYRIVQRETATPLVLDNIATGVYYQACSLIADTIEHIYDGCSALGYSNLTRDRMRIVDGWDSDDLYEIPDSLPILIMPYWDNAPAAREAMPTWDGDACIFRLEEAYMNPDLTLANLRGVNQTVRHARTLDWLNLDTDGEWRNGWYEDSTGVRWYSDVVSSWSDPRYDMMHRQFDTRTGEEFDCVNTDVCRSTTPIPSYWGPKAFVSDTPSDFVSVYSANGTQYGVFIYTSVMVRVVGCHYDWETLLSNASVGLLLARWMFSMLALHRGFLLRKSEWHSGGVGCISNARSFSMLPFAVLPRLKLSLQAFWTVGCQFEGQQVALSESWFAIYPSIVEIMLVYYSVLNTLAMVLRRRMSDVFFAPSIIALCLLHYFRQSLAESGLLTGVDGRIATQVFSDEAAKMKLVDFFSSDLALRLDGNVPQLFYGKLGILGASLVLLLLSKPIPVTRDHAKLLGGIEKSMAIRAQHVGGLTNSHDYVAVSTVRRLSALSSFKGSGLSSFKGGSLSSFKSTSLSSFKNSSSKSTSFKGDSFKGDSVEGDSFKGDSFKRDGTKGGSFGKRGSFKVEAIHGEKGIVVKPRKETLLNGYQLVRLGYVVLGGKFLITFEDWDVITLMAPLRSLHNLWNYRVFVWLLKNSTEFDGMEIENEFPEVWRVDDPRLIEVAFWRISAVDIRCGPPQQDHE